MSHDRLELEEWLCRRLTSASV